VKVVAVSAAHTTYTVVVEGDAELIVSPLTASTLKVEPGRRPCAEAVVIVVPETDKTVNTAPTLATYKALLIAFVDGPVVAPTLARLHALPPQPKLKGCPTLASWTEPNETRAAGPATMPAATVSAFAVTCIGEP